MSRAAKSLLAFGVYLAVGGAALLLAPELACRIAGLRPPGESVWVRVAGMFFLYSAAYCFLAARSNRPEFARWSLFTRPWTLIVVAASVAGGLENAAILLFGLVDVAAAVWTALALRADAASAAKAPSPAPPPPAKDGSAKRSGFAGDNRRQALAKSRVAKPDRQLAHEP